MRGYVLKTVIMSETKNKDRWYAIEKLLDDETPSVRSAVLRELKSDSESGRVFLQEISKGSDNILARHASTLIKELGWVDGVGDFLRFIRSRRYELETGWFLQNHPMILMLSVVSGNPLGLKFPYQSPMGHPLI